jgi:hypothetical protein
MNASRLQRNGRRQPNALENAMLRSHIVAGAIVIGVLSAPPAHSAPLDLKTGLWEHSVTTMTELTPSGKRDLSKLAPSARTKIEQAMSGSVSTGRRTRITEECVTPTMLEKWRAFAHSEGTTTDCKRTIVSESAKHLKTALSCDGGKTKGYIDLTVNGEQLKGSVVMVFHEQGFDRTITQDISAKWLRASCMSNNHNKSTDSQQQLQDTALK